MGENENRGQEGIHLPMSFMERLEGLFADVKLIKSDRECIKQSIESLNNNVSAIFTQLKKENEILKEELRQRDYLISELRQNIKYTKVRVANIPRRDNENPRDTFVKIANCIGFEADLNRIDICYWLKNAARNSHSSLIIDFLSTYDKSEFLKLSKAKNNILKTAFKTDGQIFISEDMGRFTYDLFKKGKELRALGLLKYIWYRNGKLFAKKDENSRPYVITRESDYEIFTRVNRTIAGVQSGLESEEDSDASVKSSDLTIKNNKKRRRNDKGLKANDKGNTLIDSYFGPESLASSSKNEKIQSTKK